MALEEIIKQGPLLEYFQRGGPVMYPLFICSALALGVFLERIWRLRSPKIVPKGVVQELEESLKNSDPEGARKLCESLPSIPIARIALAGLMNLGRGPGAIRFIIAEMGNQESAALESNQRLLGTIAYIAPLMGLLGTVSGMIKAFEVIAEHSVANPAMLAEGISEALITTAAGLTVAIPVVIMHRYIQGKATRLSLDLEKEAVSITNLLMGMDNDDSASKETTEIGKLRTLRESSG